ncbi:MAG: DsbA family oxidoreductase, partial [Janthinobacterium lividum]
VNVEYHSFELSPDTPTDFEGSESDYLALHKGITRAESETMLATVVGIAETVGLHYDFDALHHTNTVKAHQLVHYAKARGADAELKERLLKAYFEDGRHLGHLDVLADIGAEAGFDRDDVLRVLEADEFLPAVRADQAQAVELGITGVPFYVFESKYAVSGAQDAAVFRDVLETLAREATVTS